MNLRLIIFDCQTNKKDKIMKSLPCRIKYIVREAAEYGCKIYEVINIMTGNRANYFPDKKSAIEFANRCNS